MSRTNLSKEQLEELLFAFLGSLSLCEHIGDVGNAIDTLLPQLGIDEKWELPSDLRAMLGRMGVKTLNGTALGGDVEELQHVRVP